MRAPGAGARGRPRSAATANGARSGEGARRQSPRHGSQGRAAAIPYATASEGWYDLTHSHTALIVSGSVAGGMAAEEVTTSPR